MFHWLKVPAFALGFLMLFAGSAMLVPHGAAAAESLQVIGTLAGGGSFEGEIVDPEFVPYEHFMELSGQLQGVVTVDGVETAIDQEFVEQVYGSARSNCKTVYYSFLLFVLEDVGEEVQLDELAMDVPNRGLLGGLLSGCAVRNLLDGSSGDNAKLADLLNDLLGN